MAILAQKIKSTVLEKTNGCNVQQMNAMLDLVTTPSK
jgi:hypothetical protein